jgi:APA family basic amino acid/polyamine antiporter
METRPDGGPSPHVVQLRRELGLRGAVAIGIGGTVGGGIFVLVGVAGGKAGPAALIAFALAFLASFLIALPYAELACRIPMAGGGYAFARQALGAHWGFFMGWIYWGAYVFLSGYVTIGFGGYLNAITGFPTVAGASVLIALCTLVNLLGMKISGGTQTVVIAVAIVGLAGFSFWGLPHIDLDQFSPFVPYGVGGIMSAALVAFLSFGGFDMVAAAGEEIKDPERNLPRAILLTLVGVLGLYLAVAIVVVGTIPTSLLGSSVSPLADAAGIFGGDAARLLVVCCALLTTAATANAILVVTSRTVFAMARDRLLPGPLALVYKRNGAPWTAIVVNGLLIGVVALTGTISMSSSTGGFLYVLHFVPPLVALVKLRNEQSAAPRPAFMAPFPRLLVPIAFICSAGLLVASGVLGATIGSAWVLTGVVCYATYRYNRRRVERNVAGLGRDMQTRSGRKHGPR